MKRKDQKNGKALAIVLEAQKKWGMEGWALLSRRQKSAECALIFQNQLIDSLQLASDGPLADIRDVATALRNMEF